METSPQSPSLRTIINKKRPKSKLLAGNRLWIRGNFFVEGGGHKLWNCRQFSPLPRPRGRKSFPVRPADGRILISYPENHRSYPQIATFAPPVVRGKTALCAPALAAEKALFPVAGKKRGRLFPPPGKMACGRRTNAAGRAARFPFDPPRGKVWRAAGYMRECPAPLSPFSRCGRKRRADGGRFCRFACPTPPHMV